MYKAGYDPNAFVAFFEKVEADEKKEPGTIPKVFSTHPPTPDRIEAIQKEIATILPPRKQYIVTTSEFDTVKHRLQMIEANIKVEEHQPEQADAAQAHFAEQGRRHLGGYEFEREQHERVGSGFE